MQRNQTSTFFLIISLTVLSYGSSSAQSSREKTELAEARAAIAQSNAIYFLAFSKGDSSVFIDRYARDCSILAPDMPALSGSDGALTFWRIAYYKIGLRNGKFITGQVYGDGKQYVTEEGLWQSFDAEGHLFDNGKFLVLWKKTPDGWKMFRDSFSSDRGK